MLDGEIVIAGPAGLEFDALSQRIHPAEKRIRLLAESTPASFVAFDLLAEGGPLLSWRARTRSGAPRSRRPSRRRARPIHLTPVTDDPDVAADWFSRFEGAGLDGVVVKDGALTYLPDKRAMLKVKHQRTADCVVAGFRTHKDGAGVGSLLLGLFDAAGTLHHVGCGVRVQRGPSARAGRRARALSQATPRRTTPGPGGPTPRPPAGRPAGATAGTPART